MERRMKELVVDRISNLKGKLKSPKCKVLDQPNVRDTPERLHADLILVPTDKAADVIVMCKKYYVGTLEKELGINTSSNTNSTCIPCTESFNDILRTHANFVSSVGWKCLRRTRTSLICTGLQNYIRPL